MEIKIENLYLDNKNKINCTFQSGKINALIGPSQSGKTDLLKTIIGLVKIKKGKILFDNNLNKPLNRKDIAFVFENSYQQFFLKTVKDEIAFGLKNFNYKIKELDKQIKKALILVGLDETYLTRNPFRLSLGEAKQVVIASALVFNPKAIILDNPFLGLDLDNKRKIIKILKKLSYEYKKTIIVTSADVDALYEISDYFIMLNNKKVIKEGNKQEVYSDITYLKKNKIPIPNIILFINRVLEIKKIDLGIQNNINDLIRVVYRNVK